MSSDPSEQPEELDITEELGEEIEVTETGEEEPERTLDREEIDITDEPPDEGSEVIDINDEPDKPEDQGKKKGKKAKAKSKKPKAKKPKEKKPKEKKPKEKGARGLPELYTVLLALSLVFIMVGCLALWLELQNWGDYPWWKTSEAATSAAG